MGVEGGLGEKGEGMRKYKLVCRKQSGGRRAQVGTIVNGTATAVRRARCVGAVGESLRKVYACLIIALYT